MAEQTSNNGKTVAIVSYITWIGWIIAYVIHNSNKTSFGAFHLRQSGFIHLSFVALSLISIVFSSVRGLGGLISILVGIASLLLFILLIIGLLGAINNEEKSVPFIGDTAQKTLSGLT